MRAVQSTLLCLLLAFCAGDNIRAQYISTEPQHARYDEPMLDLDVIHRRTFDGDYKSLTQGDLSGLFSLDENNYLGPRLGFGAVQLKPGSFADQIARQPFYFEPGLLFRHYFTPPHVFLRPYLSANADMIWALWDYRHPLYSGKDRVTIDSICGADFGAGLGVLFQLNENFHIFGEVNGGRIFMDTETRAGIDNDFLRDTAYVGVKAGLGLSF
jgi:hypothetical protein